MYFEYRIVKIEKGLFLIEYKYVNQGYPIRRTFQIQFELPDIDSLIKKLTSDEYIEKKIKDILG